MRCIALAVVLGVLLGPAPVLAEDTKEEELRALFVEFSYLFDPYSVDFRKLRHTNLTYLAWCGEFNAKNRMGGYVGWFRFVARDKRKGSPRSPRKYVQFILEDEQGNVSAADVRKECVKDKTYKREDW